MGRELRLLLDTHALLWWWSGDPALPSAIASLIADGDNEIFASTASAWEIAIKDRLGKLGDLSGASNRYGALMERHAMRDLAIERAHALRAGVYPMTHRDPFDRLLAAQAELEDMPIVTRDPAFAAFPCRVRW